VHSPSLLDDINVKGKAMFLFDLLFGKKDAATSAREPAIVNTPPPTPTARAGNAPGTYINHDADLILSLKEDHQKLLKTFQSISAASFAGELGKVQSLLGQFQTLIQDHLLKENVRLYVYLEHQLKNDPVSHQMMHGFRHEMDGIGRVVVGFLEKYKAIGQHPDLADSFSTDLRTIGEALVARIKREEDILYPMYSAPK
jgi:hemerythrin-like domain-containing protein